MTYFPVNARSEFHRRLSPGSARLMNEGDGGVVETSRRFHAACAASNQPARSPTRGSGFGAFIDMSGVGETPVPVETADGDEAQPAIVRSESARAGKPQS